MYPLWSFVIMYVTHQNMYTMPVDISQMPICLATKHIFWNYPPTQDDSHQRFLMAFSVGEISHLEGGASGHTAWNGKAMLAVKSASNQRMNAKAMVTQEMP